MTTPSTTSSLASLPRRNAYNNVPEKQPKKSEKKSSDGKEPRSARLALQNRRRNSDCLTRNVKLLSFADDEGAADEEEPIVFKKKAIVRPDCASPFAVLRASADISLGSNRQS